jgi:hypothetical protein
VDDDGSGQVFQHSNDPCDDVRDRERETEIDRERDGPWKVRLEVGFPLMRLTTSPGSRPAQVLAFWMKPMTAGVPGDESQRAQETVTHRVSRRGGG